MKKTMTIFGVILFASVILTSCGEEEKEISQDKVDGNSTIKVDENSTMKEEENTTKKEKAMSFCDCMDLMQELGGGGNITDEQAKLYQECLDNDVPTGNSAADLKERDRKMLECR